MHAETQGSTGEAAEAIFSKLFLTPEGRADPYPLYHQLRQTAPVHRTKLGMWLLSRYDDCWAAMRDPRLGKEYAQQIEQRFGPDWRKHPSLTAGEHSMLNTTGPEHTRLRKLVTKSRPGGGDADLRWRAELRQRIETDPGRQDSVPVCTGERLAATVALLQRNSLFARCTAAELEQLAATAYPMSFEPGDMLCTEGGESPECYILEEGQAVVTVGRKGVATVGEHDVVGERGVLLDTVRSATVTAMTHMITYAISRERLRALVAGNSAAREWMMAEMHRRYPDLPPNP